MTKGGGNTLNLNPTKLCSEQRCECSPRPGDIQAKKYDRVPVKGFTKITHERQANQTFTLPIKLGDSSQLDREFQTAIKTEAYYWPGKPTRPLILAVTTTNSTDGGIPTYYTNDDGYSTGGVGGGIWKFKYGINQNDLVKWLDYLNCEYNRAIPIDLKNPDILSRFYLGDGECLKSKVVSGPEFTHEGEYEVKAYQIKTPNTHLSRVVYDGNNTDMTIPRDSVSTIKVYRWKNEEGGINTPLLVEFKTDENEYFYHKNKGTSKENINWESIDKKTSPIENPELTNLLDGARCNRFHTFKVELSKEEPYKNNSCSGQQIQVSEYRDNHIENYKVYRHTYNGGDNTLMITGFLSTGDIGQNFGIDYPIRKVAEVVVYMCKGRPLLVYYKVGKSPNYHWYRHSGGTTWTSVISGLTTNDGPDQREKILNILDGLKSDCGPPSVTIDISKGPEEWGNSSEYEDPGGSGKIKVEKKTESQPNKDPPLNYDRYDHTVKDRKSYFSIKSFQCGSGNTISKIDLSDKAVTSVSVYYWSHGEDIKGKPLLIKVEFRQQKSDPRSKVYNWYENTGTNDKNTEWQKVKEPTNPNDLSGTKLKNKLDLLNCRLNNVVIVDASKRPSNKYCHDDIKGELDSGHTHKLKVVEESSSENDPLATYKAYEHSLNESTGQPFHIVGFKNGSTGGGTTITLPENKGTPDSPLLNISKVIFYFCNSEKSPLLLYYEQQQTDEEIPNTTHNWYKNESGNDWQNVPELSSTKPNQHDKILKELDQINSPCQPPSVTICIQNLRSYTGVNVTPYPVGDATDYTEYRHAPVNKKGREYFTITQVNYEDKQIEQVGTSIEKVKEFIVYYWKHNTGNTNPLLIKMQIEGETDPKYYTNDGYKNNTGWTMFGDASSLSESDKLKSELILLNCKLNNVTDIDIGKRPKDNYCHEDKDTLEESHTPKLITVTDASKNSTYNGKLGKFAVYQHILNQEAVSSKSPPPVNFHISGFTNNGQPITFNVSPPSLPALNVPKVLVYFCDKDPTTGKPLLVHFKHIPTNAIDKQEWYQTTKEGWKAVEAGIPKGENDIPAIYTILNNYATSCKDDTLLRILLGTAAGSAGGGATTYGVYEMIRWLFMSPWPRLM